MPRVVLLAALVGLACMRPAASQQQPDKIVLTSCGANGAAGPSFNQCSKRYGNPPWLTGVTGGVQQLKVGDLGGP
jgi:hypothetical protein